jgi:L-ascorbate metabolism protein UlaG (beta-lactamase superfamily)
MKTSSLPSLLIALVVCFETLAAQQAQSWAFSSPQILTNREALLKFQVPAGQLFRVETSSELNGWAGLATLTSTGSSSYTDSAGPFESIRFYRMTEAAETNAMTGDHLATADGEVTFHPVSHASFVMTWKDKVIYCDPVGGAALFQGLPRADVVLVTHSHTDHYEASTISTVKNSNAVILAPPAVVQSLPTPLKPSAVALTNGAQTNLLEFSVQAVPAYNLTSTWHTKGAGNGYILTLGGKRVYVSGDTEDTPEMRALENIDVAFVCMNLPYTLSVDKAVSVVRQFQPKVVYVYHYRGYSNNDLNRFKQLVGTDRPIEVRLRSWY